MVETGRMFLCARCHAQVVLCTRCDRGQIYCGPPCSSQARHAAQRAAKQRYQSSRPGRFRHAERARRYRARCKFVTHQGSAMTLAGDLLVVEAAVPVPEVQSVAVDASAQSLRCHRCGAHCAVAVRLGFLRQRRPRVPDRPSGTNPPGERDDHPP